MPERDILHAIRLALGREPDLTLWRLSQGVAQLPGGRTARFGLVSGAADLIGVLGPPAGRWFALEVKTSSGRLSEQQQRWGALVRSRGGFCATVHSVEEARAALERARQGDTK